MTVVNHGLVDFSHKCSRFRKFACCDTNIFENLCNGTVIDHIPTDSLFKVVSLLDIENISSSVTIGYNLDSKKLGKSSTQLNSEDDKLNYRLNFGHLNISALGQKRLSQ